MTIKELEDTIEDINLKKLNDKTPVEKMKVVIDNGAYVEVADWSVDNWKRKAVLVLVPR